MNKNKFVRYSQIQQNNKLELGLINLGRYLLKQSLLSNGKILPCDNNAIFAAIMSFILSNIESNPSIKPGVKGCFQGSITGKLTYSVCSGPEGSLDYGLQIGMHIKIRGSRLDPKDCSKTIPFNQDFDGDIDHTFHVVDGEINPGEERDGLPNPCTPICNTIIPVSTTAKFDASKCSYCTIKPITIGPAS